MVIFSINHPSADLSNKPAPEARLSVVLGPETNRFCDIIFFGYLVHGYAFCFFIYVGTNRNPVKFKILL
jgi:hypothetical protein